MATPSIDSHAHTPDEAKPPFYRIHTYHHTHWDREWWATLQDFRIRLVDVIDDLLDTLDRDPEFRTFLLDSQTIVLTDYLEIRPENRERLTRRIREGRIECGPWYILPDEFLVSGESHLRNLLLGRRVARELDVPLQSIGYLPDTFGHIGQMPQILRGFGMDNAFMWRGRGAEIGAIKNEYLWESPDGSRVLCFWFPDGYYQMPFFHFGEPDWPAREQVGRVFTSIERFGPGATTDLLLFPYGGDHRSIDRQLPTRICEANAAIGDLGQIQWSTLTEFVQAFREQCPELETVAGELRQFGPNTPHILPGVLSARLSLKELNFRGQTWLERYAEPFSALAWLAGRRYDAGLLWRAWEFLVQNHPHDSICGCSIDQVHREMVPRFDQSRQIARIVTEKSVAHLNDAIDTSMLVEGEQALVAHNPLPQTRDGWATVWLERQEISPRTHCLRDATDADVPFQVRSVGAIRPMSDRWEWTEVGFLAESVPGMGHRTYRLSPRETSLNSKQVFFAAVQPVAAMKGSEAITDLRLGDNTLENRHLRVWIDPLDGTLTLTDLDTGHVYDGLNAFEDDGDAGDEYNYARPLNDTVLSSAERARVHISVAEAGLSRAALRVDLTWLLPVELQSDRLSRSSEYIENHTSTVISLEAGSRCVEITTEWENVSKDHRLRVLFPLGAEVTESHAQGQFEVVTRSVALAEVGNGWPEPGVATMPQQGWVSVDDGARGLLIANRGLPEYEILDDGDGTVAITLLRAVGWLSREDLLSRVGGAGPTVPTPEAQQLGPNRASYAIVPHAGSWLQSGAYRIAETYLTPLYGSTTGIHGGDRRWDEAELTLEGDHTLVMSALKRAESEDALILRVWNIGADATSATVRCRRRPTEVYRVRLDEQPESAEPLPIATDGSFQVHAGPAEIVTVQCRY